MILNGKFDDVLCRITSCKDAKFKNKLAYIHGGYFYLVGNYNNLYSSSYFDKLINMISRHLNSMWYSMNDLQNLRIMDRDVNDFDFIYF